MSDNIFDADELTADAVTADQPETEQQVEQRARDEQGRFAPKIEEPIVEQQAEEQPERTGTVPQGALHAEREKRKEYENKWKAAQATLDALAQMRQQAATRQPEQTAPPPVGDDASEVGYLRQRLEQIEGAQANQQRQQDVSRVDMEEQQQIAYLMSASEAEIRQTKPDYDSAIEHVIINRAKELALYGLSPIQVQDAIRSEAADIARSAIQQGRAPAEVAYELATLRGYVPQDGQQAASPSQTAPSGAQARVDAVGRAQAASRSLGQASGTGTTRDLNAQTIANMGPDEFEALYSTPEGRRMIDAL